jgi:hypothetical protein
VPTTFRAKLFSGLRGTKQRRRQARQTPPPASTPPQGSATQPQPDSHPTGWTPSATIRTFFKNSRSKRNSAFSRPAGALTRRVHQHLAPRQYHQPRTRGVGGAPNAQHLLTNTDFGGNVRHRPAGLNHRAGSCSRNSGVTWDACPTYGHPSRGTSSPSSQVSTVRGQRQIGHGSCRCQITLGAHHGVSRPHDRNDE